MTGRASTLRGIISLKAGHGTTRAVARRLRPEHGNTDPATTYVLLFDPVFVLIVTQATTTTRHEPGWTGIGPALLAFLVVRPIDLAFSWLTNMVRPVGAMTRTRVTRGTRPMVPASRVGMAG